MFQRVGLWVGLLHGILCYILNIMVHDCVHHYMGLFTVVSMVTVVVVSMVTARYILNVFSLVTW